MCIVMLRCLFQDHNHSHKLKSQWSQANVPEMPTMVWPSVYGGAELGGVEEKGDFELWWL